MQHGARPLTPVLVPSRITAVVRTSSVRWYQFTKHAEHTYPHHAHGLVSALPAGASPPTDARDFPPRDVRCRPRSHMQYSPAITAPTLTADVHNLEGAIAMLAAALDALAALREFELIIEYGRQLRGCNATGISGSLSAHVPSAILPSITHAPPGSSTYRVSPVSEAEPDLAPSTSVLNKSAPIRTYQAYHNAASLLLISPCALISKNR